MRSLSPVLVASFALFSSACGVTQFTVMRRAPAEVNIPPGKVLAVAPIAGTGGDVLVNELSQALLETKRFQVLERQNLKAAMTEIKLSADGHVSDESALSYGNLVGAGTLVVGEIAGAHYDERVSSVKAQCAAEGGKLVDCVQYQRMATAKLDVTLKVLETETGKLLAAKSLTAARQRSAVATDKEPPAIEAQEDLFGECRKEVIGGFIHMVAPYERPVSVTLLSDDDLPELATGNNYAQIGNWGAAVEQYRAAVTRAEAAGMKPNLVAMAHYDLGVGLGYSGSFDDGISHVERAFALDPSALYQQQVAAIRQFKEEAARLAAQEPGAK